MAAPDPDARHYLFRGGDSWRSPWEDYRWLRDNDPVHRAEHREFGEFFVLSRFADVFDAVRDTARLSSAEGLTLDPEVMELFAGRAAPIVMMDPPEHTAMRRLVSRPMTPGRVAPFESEIVAFVDDRLDGIAASRRRGRHRRAAAQAAAELPGGPLPGSPRRGPPALRRLDQCDRRCQRGRRCGRCRSGVSDLFESRTP